MKLRAVQWSIVELGIRQILGLALSILLARWFGPEPFGLVALTGFFSAAGIAILQASVTTVLIQDREITLRQESSLFWLLIATNTLASVVIVGIAVPVAEFYGFEDLKPLMWIAAGQVLASAFGILPSAVITRSLSIRPLALAGIIAFAVSSLVALWLAVDGQGLMAIALQPLTFAVVNSLVLWSFCHWRPLAVCDVGELSAVLRRASLISAASSLELAYSQGFVLIIGKFFGLVPLGLYNRAQGIQQVPGNLIGTCVTRLALPIMAEAAHDRVRLKAITRQLIQASMAISLPCMGGLAILADLVILILFGPEWAGAAPLLAFLALAGAVFPLHVINLQVPLVLGRAHRYLQIELVKKLVGLCIVLTGSLFGIKGLAISQSVFAIAAFVINAWLSRSMIQYGPLSQIADFAGSVLATGIMCLSIWLVRPHLHLGDPQNLLVLILLGAVTYLAAMGCIHLRLVRTLVRQRMRSPLGQGEA